jgi:ABC-type multidrug transport system fused ATPase/permease subunit
VIVVLEGGRQIDAGTHDELVERPGIYRETWLRQSERGESSDE